MHVDTNKQEKNYPLKSMEMYVSILASWLTFCGCFDSTIVTSGETFCGCLGTTIAASWITFLGCLDSKIVASEVTFCNATIHCLFGILKERWKCWWRPLQNIVFILISFKNRKIKKRHLRKFRFAEKADEKFNQAI